MNKLYNINLFKNIDIKCIQAIYKDKCELASHCVNIKLIKFKNNIQLCYGHVIDDNWLIYQDSVFYSKIKDIRTKYYDFSKGFHEIYIINGEILTLPQSISFKNLNTVNVTDKYYYILLEKFDVEFILDKIITGNFIGNLPIKLNYKYICDDYLYQKYKMFNNIYIFPSPRNCEKYIPFNNTHHFCVDTIFTYFERCPKDYFTYNSDKNKFLINEIKISIRNKTLDVHDYIDYGIKNFFKNINNTNFNKIIDKITYNTKNLIDYFISKDTTLLEDIFEKFANVSTNLFPNFNNKTFKFIDYFMFKNKENIDYFIYKLSNNHTEYDSQYGNWISDIFGVLIKPFTDAFLIILKEFWNFIRSPLEELINLFFEILIDVLLDIEKLLSLLLSKLEPKLIIIIDLVIKFFDILLRFIVNIFVNIENKYFLSEYIFLYIIIVYLINNTIGSLLALILFLLIFGLNRNHCSIILSFLHTEYKINNTGLYVCNFTQIIGFNLSNILDLSDYNNYNNINNKWFNIDQIYNLVETLNKTEL